ncbi:2-keto-3-deoxy-L-rhamnonate aldolase RhmA [Halobacillus alkaliphilus]|uniref:2-keto-3-deoxy-L-rhamnonate aldolase RhmA n=1 Tax=Halobacillus alkaliphilus TaxID=396056 RepID=A0A1I2JVB6_9BACI|nr:aldolase/citrate lyase family protein [Halobacillus alkaliphilus]SFF58765.1 2-keto-3-deoxy-L-rhamnonate aldolase RhmA [Halobacillus alkaliphilus]
MSLKLMYITNEEKVAQIADESGVDWIFLDLEINGKEERQGKLDTVISRHSIEDIKEIKPVLNNSELLVRVNPINENSKSEIDEVVSGGADIVMLPMFKTNKEVKDFISHVNDRAKTCLLLETPEAVENIDSILEVEGIDYIHIGLNDLHIGYRKYFMFELLVDGTVERLCNRIKEKSIPYGFGGIAKLGQGALSAENIIAEHYRLGSSMVILSRSFCNTSNFKATGPQIESLFNSGVKDIRNYEKILLNSNKRFFEVNRKTVKEKVESIVNGIEKNKVGV